MPYSHYNPTITVPPGERRMQQGADTIKKGINAFADEVKHTAAYPVARGIGEFTKLGPQDQTTWNRIQRASDGLEGLKTIPAEQWVREYVRHAHDLSSTPLRTTDGGTSTGGEIVLNTRYNGGKLLRDKIVPSATRVFNKMPTAVQNAITNIGNRTGVTDAIDPYVKGTDKFVGEISAGGTGPGSFYDSSKQHYNAYAHSPATAYIQIGNETASTARDAADQVAAASMLPENQRNAFLHKRMDFTADDPSKYDTTPIVNEVLSAAGINGKQPIPYQQGTPEYNSELERRKQAIIDKVFHGNPDLSQGEWIRQKVMEAAGVKYRPGMSYGDFTPDELASLKRLSLADVDNATGDLASRFAKMNYGGFMNYAPGSYNSFTQAMKAIGKYQEKPLLFRATDAIGDAASSTLNSITNAYNAASNGVGRAAKYVGDGASDIANEVGNAASRAWGTTKNTARRAIDYLGL